MHFSLQYNEWESEYKALEGKLAIGFDPTGDTAVRMRTLSHRMELVRSAAELSDRDISSWIFRSVTTGDTYPTFEAEGCPFGRDYFYVRLRRYFYYLDKIRE